jgi:hypothetical protein
LVVAIVPQEHRQLLVTITIANLVTLELVMVVTLTIAEMHSHLGTNKMGVKLAK